MLVSKICDLITKGLAPRHIKRQNSNIGSLAKTLFPESGLVEHQQDKNTLNKSVILGANKTNRTLSDVTQKSL